MDYAKEFRIAAGTKVDLSKIDPNFTGDFTGPDAEEKAKKQLKKNKKKIKKLQEALYAEGKQSILLVMQAPDAAGKDGTIGKVFEAMNPNGHHVYSFKAPSTEELSHDFLWRIHDHVPRKGHVTTFNRSHYEDILAVRVRKLAPPEVWQPRYEQINQFEQLLAGNGTSVLKFYLHIDKKEQLQRLWDRVANPEKHQKVNLSDYQDRALWDDFQEAYQDVFNRCSTDDAPWFVIPGNNKWFSRLAVSEILLQHLESLDIDVPDPEIKIEEVKEKYFGIKNPGDKPRFDLI